MTYLVTGGWGYIGSRIVRDLVADGQSVIVFDASEPGPGARAVIGEKALAKVHAVRGDVSDAMQLYSVVEENKVAFLIHNAFAMGAADYRPKRSTDAPSLTNGRHVMAAELNLGLALRVNCGGMLNVLEAARLFNVRRVVFTSALAALGLGITEIYHEPIGDRAVFAPDTMYGGTKVLNEVMAKIYADKFRVDNIGFRIARTFGIDSPLPFTDFLRRVAIEEKVDLPDPDYINSYIYVNDCANAHIFACTAPSTKTRVFNLREGEYSNRDLLAAINRVHPAARVTMVSGKGDGIPVPRLDATGIREELRWKARYSLDDALREIFNHWRQQSGLSPLQ